jgi:hypothetical protein
MDPVYPRVLLSFQPGMDRYRERVLPLSHTAPQDEKARNETPREEAGSGYST